MRREMSNTRAQASSAQSTLQKVSSRSRLQLFTHDRNNQRQKRKPWHC